MRYTDWTWVIVGIQLLAVEVFALVSGDPPLTSSMRHGADRWMLWPALFGALSGHFFGTRGAPSWMAPFVLIPAALLVLYRDLFVRNAVPTVTHMEIFLLFLGMGAWFWGVKS